VARHDVLGLFIKPGADGTPDEAVFTVNGQPLIDLVRAAEAPFAAAEGHADLAGSYCALPARVAYLPSKHLLGEPEPLYSDLVSTGEGSKAALLVCECGEPGCWPLCARIDVTADLVRWSDFEQPHRTGDGDRHWSYETLGPFEFERAAYEAALREPR
jgi:hypothetical protein